MLFSAKLAKRSYELERCVAFVTMLGEQLRYTLAPMDKIMRVLAERTEFEGLPFVAQCSHRCDSGERFPVAFTASLDACPGNLIHDDVMTLLPLGETLGAVDLEGQLSAIGLCLGLLQDRLSGARQYRTTHGKLYTTLGLLAGLAVAIIML